MAALKLTTSGLTPTVPRAAPADLAAGLVSPWVSVSASRWVSQSENAFAFCAAASAAAAADAAGRGLRMPSRTARACRQRPHLARAVIQALYLQGEGEGGRRREGRRGSVSAGGFGFGGL